MARAHQVAIFAGSLRDGSYNRRLLAALLRLAPQNLKFWELAIDDIPLFNQDLEDQGIPIPVADFKRSLLAADATLIVSPEYSHSVPGVLKNALDWASRDPDVALRNKPVAICGASSGGFGTARGQEHLRLVLAAHGAIVMPLPLLYISKAATAFDKDGNLAKPKSQEAAEFFLASFVEFIDRVAG